MKQVLLCLNLLLCAGASASARAQDAGQVGVTLGYPSAVGVIWHVTNSVAVRPDISFSSGSTDSLPIPSASSIFGGSAVSGESSSTTVTAGVSGLLYLRNWDKLRAYVSPRYSYGRLTSSSGSMFLADSKNATHALTGSFGAHYQVHRRFAMFGETGFGYNHSRNSFTSSLLMQVIPVGLNVPAPVTRTEEITSHTWGTRSGAGVIFYFK